MMNMRDAFDEVPFDGFIIPGGGSQKDPRDVKSLPSWTLHRLDVAKRLSEIHSEEQQFLVLSGGTTHKPPVLDEHGYPIYEADSAAAYLMSLGVPSKDIWKETSSYDTIGNAYFCRMMTEHTHLRFLLVITSDFHAERTKEIFDFVFSLPPVNNAPYTLRYLPLSHTTEDMDARVKREQESLASFNELKKQFRTFAEFHKWMLTEHKAYAPRKLGEPRGDALDAAVSGTY